MSITKYTPLICFILFSTATLLRGQESDTYTTNFKVYGLKPGEYTNILASDSSGKLQSIEFKTKTRSTLYSLKLTQDNPWILFFKKSASPNVPNQLIGKIRILSSSSEWLLIFSKNIHDPISDQFIISKIRDDIASFPNGHMQIMNFTDKTLIGETNGERFNLGSYQTTQCINYKTNNAANITILTEGASRYHLAYKNKITLDPNSRALLILRPPARTGSIRIGGHLLIDTPN